MGVWHVPVPWDGGVACTCAMGWGCGMHPCYGEGVWHAPMLWGGGVALMPWEHGVGVVYDMCLLNFIGAMR